MKLSDAFSLYKSDVIVFSNQSSKTEESHTTTLHKLIEYFGDIDISDLTFPMVRDWKLHLEKDRCSETVRNYIIKLRVVLVYLQKQNIDCLNPDSISVPKRKQKVPEFLPKEEVKQLIKDTSCIRAKAIISLLYASGIRVSELCALNRGDLHDNSFTVVGKGGKARLCFFDKRTDKFIKLYLKTRKDNSPALFVSRQSKKRITSGNVQEIFRNIKRKTGKEVHAHTLRHSFATDLMKNGMHIYSVSRLLGHSSIQTTQMYLHVTDIDLQRDYNKSHKI